MTEQDVAATAGGAAGDVTAVTEEPAEDLVPDADLPDPEADITAPGEATEDENDSADDAVPAE